jgi:hypothetical protein
MRWPQMTLVVLAACLCATACNNDNISNDGVIGGGGRFALVIEPARTAIDGTHFLVDTATGDLWMLKADGSGHGQWSRVADAPQDVKPLTLQRLLGVTKPTAEPR